MKKDARFEKFAPVSRTTLLLALALVLGSGSVLTAPTAKAEAQRTPTTSQIQIRDEQSRKLTEEIEALEAQNAHSRNPVLSERIALKKMGLAKLEQGTEVLVQELLALELEEVLSETSKSAILLAGMENPDQLEKPAQGELETARTSSDGSGRAGAARAGIAAQGN